MSSARRIRIGSLSIGGSLPVVLQSMTATKTVDVRATAQTCQKLSDAGAGIVRVAVDTPKDAEALKEIRKQTDANLSVDLQENYRLAETIAPFVDKIRYNPGHLYHAELNVPWQDKVKRLVNAAGEQNCALRIGVNCGSLDPSVNENGSLPSALLSAIEHTDFLESLGFDRFCVSIKSSDPKTVVALNRKFAELRPDVPLHLGVTEAGMPPEGIWKSRLALEPLLAAGIGDTLRVSLTVPNEWKTEEIEAGRQILENVRNGDILTDEEGLPNKLDIISCPSCARVENSRFIELAQRVRSALQPFKDLPLTIAVMGCRVNGPGETDHADFGLWCGADAVHLKRGTQTLGAYSFEDVITKLTAEIEWNNKNGTEPRT